MRMLSHCRVQVVLYHEHDGSSLFRLVRILVNAACIHVVCRSESVHIYASVVAQLGSKLRCKCLVEFLREISQGIAQCKLLFVFCKYLLTLWRMVHFFVILTRLRQHVWYAGTYRRLKFLVCHNI